MHTLVFLKCYSTCTLPMQLLYRLRQPAPMMGVSSFNHGITVLSMHILVGIIVYGCTRADFEGLKTAWLSFSSMA